MEQCITCEAFLSNYQEKDFKETIRLIHEQFVVYNATVNEKTKELEDGKRKLTEFKLTSIYMLQQLDKKSTELTQTKSNILNIIDNVNDALIVFDADGIIELINQSTLDLLGYTREELVGKPAHIIFGGEDQDKLFKKIVDTLIEKGVVKDREIVFLTKTGEKIPMSLSGQSKKSEQSGIGGFVCTARDIRAMSRLVRDLEESRNDLERKVDERTRDLRAMHGQFIQSAKLATVGQFAAGIAHEINNPLGAIINYIRVILANHQLQGQEKGYLELSLKGLFKIENIVRQVLGYSARKTAEPRYTLINQAVEDSIAFMHHKLTKKNIELDLKLDKALSEILIDPSQIQQIFTNVISNAVDAMEQSGNLSIETASLNGEQTIRFTDTGKGIKEDDLHRIFDPFFTTKDVGEGTGLGLFIAYNIIQIYQGKITITSTVGKGTTVIICFPESAGIPAAV